MKPLAKNRVDLGIPPAIRFNVMVVGETGSGKVSSATSTLLL